MDGRLVSERQARVSVFDHAFLYGDGLYETVRVVDGRILQWPPHYRRFKASARTLGFSFRWTAVALARAICALAVANRSTDATIRLTLSRGAGPLGLDPSVCPAPSLILQQHPPRDLNRLRREGVAIALVPMERALSAHKTVSAQSLVLARAIAKRQGAFEAVLVNGRGEVTEGTTTNLFFVRHRVLHTPALACGIVAGITRADVLRRARRLGMRVREGRYRAADLLRADEIFLTNVSFGILPVKTLILNGRQREFFSTTGMTGNPSVYRQRARTLKDSMT